jgi:hypothetical protein
MEAKFLGQNLDSGCLETKRGGEFWNLKAEVTNYIKKSVIICTDCSSPNIIGIIKLTRMNGRDNATHLWGRVHIESMGSIKSDLREIRCESVDWIVLALDSLQKTDSVITEI